MTPTLLGRWHTRIWLLATVGILVTIFFGSWFETIVFDGFVTPFVVLFWVGVLGFLWDAIYNVIQQRRWDSDWPPAYQLFAGIAEAVLLYVLIRSSLAPGVPPDLPAWMFFSHYSMVWLATFLMSQGPMRILFPQWRFRGGQLGRHPATRE